VPDFTLAIIEGRQAGLEFAVSETTVIGRDPSADIVLSDSRTSRRHASVLPRNRSVAVEDLGSTSGTFVNGQRVRGTQELRAGDRIRVGGTVLELRGKAPPAPPASAQSASRQVTRVTEVPPLPSQPPAPATHPAAEGTRVVQIPAPPVLVFVEGPRTGTEIPVTGQVVVGRDEGVADIVLPSDPEISRRHATFAPAGAGLTVQDLGSTNGTFVNGHRVSGAVALRTGDRVQLGATILEVRRLAGETAVAGPALQPAPAAPHARAPGANTIEAEGLVKEFDGHRAVDGVSLFVHPGEIYGFLGPNGAGKSTVVHMLVTLLPPTSGHARVAGFDVSTQGADVRSSIGVALQAAALDLHLNAWEHMELQTALQGIPRAERRQRAEELLARVGLTEAAGRRVGGYSGGMKRRLDLALALVHHPRVLFLDEPTTGLDPQSRAALWEEIARLVKEEGMTVFLTTQYLEEADVLADRVAIIDHGEIVAENTPAALKEEIGRPTLEVAPEDSTQFEAVGAVLQRFGELESAVHRGVAVRLAPGVDNLADVIRALDAEGVRVTNVELHAPSLDDVFLTKTGRSLEGAAEAAEAAEGDGASAVEERAPRGRRRRRGSRA
jgi:ABC-2 type transport system ATP-binding protein